MSHTDDMNLPGSTELVGRDHELAELAAALGRARTHGAAVLVAGEAGIGKSAILEVFADLARAEGAVVLRGATATMDRAVPYAPIAGALRALLHPLDEPRRRALIGTSRTELARLLPGMDLGNPAGGTEPEDGRLRLQSALLDVLERAADPALVLIIEDVHWADASTVDLLSAILASLGAAPMLVVLSFRTDELRPSHPIRATLAEWERTSRVGRLNLGALPDHDLERLLDPIADGDGELVREAVERAGGNPYVALELAAAGADGTVPTGLREAILTRLGRLSTTAQDLVRAAAAGGLAVSHDLLAAVVDLRPSELRPALREAVDGHFLVPDDEGYTFRHALMREVLHDDLLPGERRDTHRRYAAALDGVPDLQRHGRWAALAEHRAAANDLDGAFSAAMAAADESAEASAFAEAADHLARAADLWDDVPAAAAQAGVGKGRAGHRSPARISPTRGSTVQRLGRGCPRTRGPAVRRSRGRVGAGGCRAGRRPRVLRHAPILRRAALPRHARGRRARRPRPSWLGSRGARVVRERRSRHQHRVGSVGGDGTCRRHPAGQWASRGRRPTDLAGRP